MKIINLNYDIFEKIIKLNNFNKNIILNNTNKNFHNKQFLNGFNLYDRKSVFLTGNMKLTCAAKKIPEHFYMRNTDFYEFFAIFFVAQFRVKSGCLNLGMKLNPGRSFSDHKVFDFAEQLFTNLFALVIGMNDHLSQFDDVAVTRNNGTGDNFVGIIEPGKVLIIFFL